MFVYQPQSSKFKILLDENISYRLIKQLSDIQEIKFHHINEFKLRKAIEIFDFARRNDFTILTFDADFCTILVERYGFPPKIIWLRTGNRRTVQIAKLIRENLLNIYRFLEN